MRSDVVAQKFEIDSRAFHARKAQDRETARDVVDEHDRHAARATSLEPGMRTAVDLDQPADVSA